LENKTIKSKFGKLKNMNKEMQAMIPKERFEELLFEQIDNLHTIGRISGFKLATTMRTKVKNYLFIEINGKKIQLTIGDKAFKQIKDATNNSNTLEQ